MKKGLVLLCLFVSISIGLSARDIKTTGGETFKNVSITGITPTGIDISFLKNNIFFIKHLMFTDLSADMQKEFGYNPKKAEAYLTNLKKHAEATEKKHKEAVKKQTDFSEAQHKLRSQIEASAVNVVIKMTEKKPDGMLGWANVIRPLKHSSGHMGIVFVYGLIGIRGGAEARVIYPTGQHKYGYPCYAGTLTQAMMLKQAANK